MAIAVCAAVWVVPAPAAASGGDAQLWSQLMLASASTDDAQSQWGPGIQVGFSAGITDFWSIAGGVESSYHFQDDADDLAGPGVLGVFGGVRYNIDVFQYVPFVGLSVENFVARPAGSDSLLGAKATVGLDWRYDRHGSIGAMIELHTALTDPANFPIYSTFGVNWSWHFRL